VHITRRRGTDPEGDTKSARLKGKGRGSRGTNGHHDYNGRGGPTPCSPLYKALGEKELWMERREKGELAVSTKQGERSGSSVHTWGSKPVLNPEQRKGGL